jgi:hypothetical protein
MVKVHMAIWNHPMKLFSTSPKSFPSHNPPARSDAPSDKVPSQNQRWHDLRQQTWVLYASLVWSILYTLLGFYWAVGGPGFPYAPVEISVDMGPLAGRFGRTVNWIFVIAAGFPAVIAGASMLRGIKGRLSRTLLITFGILLSGILLLAMTNLDLLVLIGYIPYAIFSLFKGATFVRSYLEGWTQWGTIHQLLCLIGGFLWLASTVCYTRLSVGACLHCGRSDNQKKWTSPGNAACWGRIAIYVSLVVPLLYAFTRYAWALGIPLGMSEEYLRSGQELGTWTSGLFLATFGLVGGFLSLGLVQHWGEVFPNWMIGLARRRVPIGLAVVPAALVSVLLTVGGVGIWFGLNQMIINMTTAGLGKKEIVCAIIVQVGPTLLFPLWGAALAVGTLGYYYRRRGPCRVCGRG